MALLSFFEVLFLKKHLSLPRNSNGAKISVADPDPNV
jgi:hypothetical protein